VIDTVLKFAIAGFAIAFVILLALTIVFRRRAASAQLLRAGTGSLGLAGLLFILAGLIGKGEFAFFGCGFMFLVLATGLELGPRKG
jgi:hypothetical protein